ncbi:hypothetical protein K3495_g7298 [Podosphaera aphanis]|nr:hypothetical protein K3495_g7298 [Podosphaera aphanis]
MPDPDCCSSCDGVDVHSDDHERLPKDRQHSSDDNPLIGGYDPTPIPSAPDGYTVKFTFHRAQNLPMSDIKTRSSDPFLTATLTSDLPKRHKSDPDLFLRTPTIYNTTNPEWNTQWIVAGIPSTGFKVKCRLYDEDQRDADDRLGNVTVRVDRVRSSWPGLNYKSYTIKKRAGSKRAYLTHACLAMLDTDVDMDGFLFLSAEVIGKSEKPHGRMYTLGLTTYFRHFSPLIGILAGTKAPRDSIDENNHRVQRYDFQANQFQLEGPVPAEMYHRFVEFKPFVKGMFDNSGLRGHVLNRLLHHQHNRIYNFCQTTEYGTVRPCSEVATMQFLNMVHFAEGWRTFTYVLTLDGLFRFTETGKEYGIDLLSKHTMHSDVSIYIAYSGEFIVRRAHRSSNSDTQDYECGDSTLTPDTSDQESSTSASTLHSSDQESSLQTSTLEASSSSHDSTPREPNDFILIIDNDSGTYRPNGTLLPLLKAFLNKNLPGLHIETRECMDEAHIKMKAEQRELKKREGNHIQMVQYSDDDESSISSSDEESLDRRAQGKKMGKMDRIYAAIDDPKHALKCLIDGG